MAEQGDLKTAFCNKCGNETTHHIVLLNRDDWSEVIGTYDEVGEITIEKDFQGQALKRFLEQPIESMIAFLSI